MFIITNNHEIRITKGEKTDQFPLILNKGSTLEPNIYLFIPNIYLGGQTSTEFTVTFDEEVISKRLKDSGLYSFYYLDNKWHLFEDEISLDDYAIKCTGTLENEDAFSIIRNKSNEDYVTFYIMEPNALMQDWLVKKTFYRKGYIISEYDGRIPEREEVSNIVDEYGNINLLLDSKDTNYLDSGEYNYVIQALIINRKTGKPIASTVTNRLPFYVIDDNIDRRWK